MGTMTMVAVSLRTRERLNELRKQVEALEEEGAVPTNEVIRRMLNRTRPEDLVREDTPRSEACSDGRKPGKARSSSSRPRT